MTGRDRINIRTEWVEFATWNFVWFSVVTGIVITGTPTTIVFAVGGIFGFLTAEIFDVLLQDEVEGSQGDGKCSRDERADQAGKVEG